MWLEQIDRLDFNDKSAVHTNLYSCHSYTVGCYAQMYRRKVYYIAEESRINNVQAILCTELGQTGQTAIDGS